MVNLEENACQPLSSREFLQLAAHFLFIFMYACVLSYFSCVWLCDPMDCSLPVSSVQARILEQMATPSSQISSWPRDWTCDSCIGGFFTTSATWEALFMFIIISKSLLSIFSFEKCTISRQINLCYGTTAAHLHWRLHRTGVFSIIPAGISIAESPKNSSVLLNVSINQFTDALCTVTLPWYILWLDVTS